MSNKSYHNVFERLAQSARSNKLIVFFGAGLSIPYNLPNWVQLAKDLGLQNTDLRDLPNLFSKYVSLYGKLAFHDFLEQKLGLRPADVLLTTRLLLEIRANTLITTNCDRIVESAASQLGAPIRVFINNNDLEDFNTTPWIRLIKLHGSLDDKESLVFTSEEYKNHPDRAKGIRNKIAELMCYCTTLYIGYSMADPDFFDLITIMASLNTGNVPQMVGLFSNNEINDNWRKLHIDDRLNRHVPLLELPYEEFGDTPTESVTNVLKELRELISPTKLPTLQKQYIIFTNGYTATLKSELASYLANCLGIPLFATHRYGRCTSNGLLEGNKRENRYQKMFADADQALKRGQSVVLDGTFSDPKWRKVVYNLADKFNINIIIIKTMCDDESYIRIRLWRRRLDHSRSEQEVTNFENYLITRHDILDSPIEKDPEYNNQNVGVLTFENHGNRRVILSKGNNYDLNIVASLIRISHLMSNQI